MIISLQLFGDCVLFRMFYAAVSKFTNRLHILVSLCNKKVRNTDRITRAEPKKHKRLIVVTEENKDSFYLEPHKVHFRKTVLSLLLG